MSMIDNLVRQLRDACETCPEECEVPCWAIEHLGPMAADEIERLLNANEVMREGLPKGDRT